MNLQALLPLIILAVGALVSVLLAAFARRHQWVLAAAIVTLALFLGTSALGATLFGASAWQAEPLPAIAAPLLQVDRFTVFYWLLIGLTTLVTMLFCYSHFQPRTRPTKPADPEFVGEAQESPEELYGLLMLAALGACVLVASVHFLSLFLGLELLSLSLFVLIAYRCRWAEAVEAGIKYLVLSGLATGLLLFGIALVYTYTGTLGFVDLGELPGSTLGSAYWSAGLALIFAGLAFKLSLAPFHFWTPDVYQGASAPVSAFLATVSKTAVLAVLLRLTGSLELEIGAPLWAALAGISGASILIGNWLALRQQSLKRLLGYSSVAHMGYALAALLAAGPLAVEAVSFYLAFYSVTTLGAFGVIVALSDDEQGHGEQGHNEQGHDIKGLDQQGLQEREHFDALRGLFWRRPLLAGVLTLMMLSLAGIPLTAGFFGKFYVLVAGAEAGLWLLMLLVVAGSAIGLYYYLRVILTLIDQEEIPRSREPSSANSLNSLTLGLLTLALLWLGVYPEPLMAWARQLGG